MLTGSIESDSPQHDGRRLVVEVYTDAIGVAARREYMTEPGVNVTIGLAARAAAIEEFLAAKELAENMAEVDP